MFDAMEIIFVLISMAAWIWLTARIWKSSAVGAVLSFFFALPAFYFLFKYWSDKEHGIRMPFFINLAINSMFIAFALSTPTFKSDSYLGDWRSEQRIIPVKTNPEMDRWCGQNTNSVYSVELGTCIEVEPGQKAKRAQARLDVMDQLDNHFYENGLQTRYTEVDETTPGSRGLADIPEISRVMHFEIKAKSLVPTIVTVAECDTQEICATLAARMDKPDAPASVASNGNLLFMGVHLMGDAEKIRHAKRIFQSFQAS